MKATTGGRFGRRRPALVIALGLIVSLLLAACGGVGKVDPAVLAPLPSPTPIAEPDHVVLPKDDAPHTDLTEWWYYTGHLAAQNGRTYGFELVIFQGNRQGTPPAYAAHFAVTDNARNAFHYDQRSEVSDTVHAGPGLNLNMNGWIIDGGNGHDHLAASMPGYAIDLNLNSLKPAVLHDGKGLISFGPAGDSYYYSRTRLAVSGSITDNGQAAAVTGLAWMDHQWGNFVSGSGGWDWYSIQLNDDTEMMLFVLRNSAGAVSGAYATYVKPDGSALILSPSDITSTPTGSWTSPATGITYPSGWILADSALNLSLRLTPTVKDQELNTTQSTGIVYWEGDVAISGTKGASPIAGQGYVELVGYQKK